MSAVLTCVLNACRLNRFLEIIPNKIMLYPSDHLAVLRDLGVTLFTGVPDSPL